MFVWYLVCGISKELGWRVGEIQSFTRCSIKTIGSKKKFQVIVYESVNTMSKWICGIENMQV